MGIFAEDETVRPEELCELTEEGDIALKDKNCIVRLGKSRILSLKYTESLFCDKISAPTIGYQY